MVINKLFGKKDSKADINSLKERFSQVSGNPQDPSNQSSQTTVQVPPQQSSTNTNQQSIPVSSSPVQVHDALGNPLVEDTPSVQQMQAPASQPQVPPPVQVPQFGQQPLGSLQPNSPVPSQQVQTPSQPQQQVETASIPQSVPAPTQAPAQPANTSVDLPSWAVESAGEEIATELGNPQVVGSSQNQNKAAETLEQIEDKFYDAKLNSLIIDQVKELIEIDNNLNARIDDASSEIKKEIAEREKLSKKVDEHFDKVKELETNMEKFLGLYEMVTNQFNPFVDKGSSELFLDDADKKYDTPVIQNPNQASSPVPAQQPNNPIPAELQAPVSATPSQAPVQQAQAPPQQAPGSTWTYCPIHHNIHPSLHFELSNGQKLSSIYDVLAVLETMDDATFAAHVNLRQNDLSQWIYKVLGLTDLGQQLDLIKTKPEMIQSIRSYIQNKMKQANQG